MTIYIKDLLHNQASFTNHKSISVINDGQPCRPLNPALPLPSVGKTSQSTNLCHEYPPDYQMHVPYMTITMKS